MELMSNCSNPKGIETTEPVKMTLRCVLGHIAAIGLMLLGFCIMLAFSEPTYVEPHFQHTAQMIMGFGILCLLGGGRIAISLSSESENSRDMHIVKLLSAIGMAFAVLMIVIGARGNFMS